MLSVVLTERLADGWLSRDYRSRKSFSKSSWALKNTKIQNQLRDLVQRMAQVTGMSSTLRLSVLV